MLRTVQRIGKSNLWLRVPFFVFQGLRLELVEVTIPGPANGAAERQTNSTKNQFN
jgi:hypothetical protein